MPIRELGLFAARNVMDQLCLRVRLARILCGHVLPRGSVLRLVDRVALEAIALPRQCTCSLFIGGGSRHTNYCQRDADCRRAEPKLRIEFHAELRSIEFWKKSAAPPSLRRIGRARRMLQCND